MRRVVLYMTTTLDCFIAGPGNELDRMTGAPDQALSRRRHLIRRPRPADIGVQR